MGLTPFRRIPLFDKTLKISWNNPLNFLEQASEKQNVVPRNKMLKKPIRMRFLATPNFLGTRNT